MRPGRRRDQIVGSVTSYICASHRDYKASRSRRPLQNMAHYYRLEARKAPGFGRVPSYIRSPSAHIADDNVSLTALESFFLLLPSSIALNVGWGLSHACLRLVSFRPKFRSKLSGARIFIHGLCLNPGDQFGEWTGILIQDLVELISPNQTTAQFYAMHKSRLWIMLNSKTWSESDSCDEPQEQ